MKKPNITKEEMQILEQMSVKWSELEKNAQPHHVFIDELRNVQNVISPRRIISIISHFVKTEHNG